MSYISLYRKWRPKVFEDVVEQEHVVKTLRNSIVSDRIAHAYLFCGTRGTGKTTMAHIFSRAINCLSPNNGDPCNSCEICTGILSGSILDVVEIDAASNNSVDNVREIRDEVVYAPSQAKYKVYIIDEVHMLSSGAFNALLKTLEEPPSHVVFILATTEPHKLPATILSRCQRFDFRRITGESILVRLEEIAQANSIDLHGDAGRLIARMADGALRDAISILDQCIAIGNSEIAYDNVLAVVGIVNDSFMGDMVDAICKRDITGILSLVDRLVMDGKDIAKFIADMVLYFRNLLVCKITDKPESIVEAPSDAVERMKEQAQSFTQDEIICIIKELSSMEANLRWAVHPRILLEAVLIRICEGSFNIEQNDVLGRLNELERKLSSGNITVMQAQHTVPEVTKIEAPARSTPVPKPEPKEPAAGIPVKSIGKQKQLDGWNGIIDEFKKSGRMVIYSNLISTRAVELDDKIIGIVFATGSGINRMFVSKFENLEVIEEMLSKKLGREVKVKCIEEEDLNSIDNSGPETAEEKDELVEKAQDMARKLNVPINIIDE